MSIANKHVSKNLLSSEKAQPKSLGHSKRWSYTSKNWITPQGHVASITLQVQAPQEYASSYPRSQGYCRLCLDAHYASETYHVSALERCVILLYQRESNKITSFGQKSSTPSKGRLCYRVAAGPSVYHPLHLVTQHSSRNPRTPSRHQGGNTKSLTQIN